MDSIGLVMFVINMDILKNYNGRNCKKNEDDENIWDLLHLLLTKHLHETIIKT